MAKKKGDFREVGAVKLGDVIISPSRLFKEGTLIVDMGNKPGSVAVFDIPGFGSDTRTGPVRTLRGEEKAAVLAGAKPGATSNASSGTTPATPTAPVPSPIKPVPSLKYSSKWDELMRSNFPSSFKEGGLVRGAGKATKGRGRGKMV
jgi:hypothetical protein